MSDNIPSKDPAADSSMGAMLRETMRKYMMSIDGMLPATVISYNRQTNRATVVPSIVMLTTGGESLARAPYANVPVLALGGGGATLTWPIKPGDTGWIEACDRDISLWLQSGGGAGAWPNTHRIHSFSDARFIPDTLAKHPAPSTVAADEVCLSHGETYIAVGPNGVRVVGGLTIDGVVFGTHKHSGVQPGGANTGGPL